MKTVARLAFLLGVCALCGAPSALAGAPPSAADRESRAEVPELLAFHEVIYRVWHHGWPAKDIALLTKLAPEVREGARQVAEASLPGILRDKAAAWRSGVEQLQEAAAAYAAAVAAKEDAQLLDAAERLHAQFEALVRIIRPALKELDAFHVVLYRLYHHELSAAAVERISASAVELKARMAELNQAQLSSRHGARQAAFNAVRARLSAAVDELAARTGPTTPFPEAKAAVERLHTAYQELAAVFD